MDSQLQFDHKDVTFIIISLLSIIDISLWKISKKEKWQKNKIFQWFKYGIQKHFYIYNSKILIWRHKATESEREPAKELNTPIFWFLGFSIYHTAIGILCIYCNLLFFSRLGLCKVNVSRLVSVSIWLLINESSFISNQLCLIHTIGVTRQNEDLSFSQLHQFFLIETFPTKDVSTSLYKRSISRYFLFSPHNVRCKWQFWPNYIVSPATYDTLGSF